MTEIRFYHLQTQSLEQALPTILAKALAGGRRIVVRSASEAECERLNELLWTYRADSFLPHGGKKDEFPQDQPVYLTDGAENPNGADVLVATGGAALGDPAGFSLCCEIFDGRDEAAVAAARAKWAALKDSGHTLTYWQQTPQGGWNRKS